MKIACPSCGRNANLPDDKIPKDKDFSFKCPKCGASVPVKASAGDPGEDGSVQPAAGMGPDTSKRQTGGPKQALVCMAPSLARNRIMAGLKHAGLNAQLPDTPIQALKHLEYSVYPLVIIDTAFDTDKTIVAYMNNMDMFLRRKICLVRLGPVFETGNAMTALELSANYVIRSQDLEQEDASLVNNVLAVALSEHEQMYAVFNDSMKAAGKA
ncbi:zinc-ribbon domain-containing protein [Desulfobacter latus]|uniref:Zinc-ribbon domain-containing protein n=1 Tax=Desulfobacter latus TaxID=2292 RepID=A0A850T7T3_9BACT|nr:zinc-ribbon domain-containing protein [Desulfobacter latus]NWH05502.1 zinc-ribbon domain-containing protein [Desulfobacter latus]